MANTGRGAPEPLSTVLERDAPYFNFFQAVRLAERLTNSSESSFGEVRASAETIRFHAKKSMAFAPSDIHKITHGTDELGNGSYKTHMVVTFMGLYGPSSPLPAHLNEMVVNQASDNSDLADFLDLFNHRLVSMLVRIWRRSRYPVSFQTDLSDDISKVISSMIGIDPTDSSLRNQVLFANSPLMVMRSMSAKVVADIISDALEGVHVTIDEFTPRKAKILEEQRWLLGKNASELGVDAMPGAFVDDPTGKFTLNVGPVDLEMFRTLLFARPNHDKIEKLLNQIVQGNIIHQMRLSILNSEAPEWRLGEHRPLGHEAWLGTPIECTIKIPQKMQQEPRRHNNVIVQN